MAGSVSLSDLDTIGAARAIELDAVDAAVTIGSGATMSGTTSAAIDIDGGTGAFTYNGTMTVATIGPRGPAWPSARPARRPGTVTFGGTITATAGTGISLTRQHRCGHR